MKNITIPTGQITLDDVTNDIKQRTKPRATKTTKKPQKEIKSFPIDVLPLKAQELVKDSKIALGIPSDMLSVSMLLAASSAAGNTSLLDVKNGVEQRAVFYMVLVGLPNSNKSGALKFAINPLLKKDAENFDEFQLQQAAWEEEQAKPKNERDEVSTPIFNRLIITDSTPEAVASSLADSPRGMVLYRDELAGFIKDFNRYHQGSELEFWLSNWSGVNLSIDRKSSDPIRIKNPFLSLIGTIQPGVLEEMAKGTRSVNGFLDRFLFCWPEGLKKPLWSEKEMSPLLVEDYEKAINRLLGLNFNPDGSAQRLKLSEQAKKQLFSFFNEDNKKLCDDAENEQLAGIYGKFDFHIPRLIIALHLIHWGFSNQEELPLLVEAYTVTRAIKVGEYFRAQALKVYNAIHQTSPVEKLPINYQKLYEDLPEIFKTGDGELIADKHSIPQRTFRNFLSKNKGILFEQIKFGEYSRIY